MFTVDTPVAGARLRDKRNGFSISPQISLGTVLDALPQTQCRRCGYDDCAAYARAIAHEGAPINQCPPGGQEGIVRLAALTGRPAVPLNPENGSEAPRQVAVVDEDWCIGCTLCVKAYPVNCIVGGSKRMHSDRGRLHRLRPVRERLPGGLHCHARRNGPANGLAGLVARTGGEGARRIRRHAGAPPARRTGAGQPAPGPVA